jgi:ketosteroid isomerase-like protein
MQFLLMSLLAALLPFSVQSDNDATVKQEIRDSVIKCNGTYAENDLDGYFSFYAEDATLIWGRSRTSVADYSKSWHELIGGGGGVEKNDITDIQVRVIPGGDVAISTYHLEVNTRSVDGEVSKVTAIETDVWQKRDGAWKIVSVHYTSRPIE